MIIASSRLIGVAHAVLLLSWLASPLVAKEVTVVPAAAGGEPALTAALRMAADGDVVRVAKGVYSETIVVDKRLTIIGEPGAVLDPSEPFHAKWQAAPEVGKGVYKTSVERRPTTLMLDGKIIAEIDERRTGEGSPWEWKTLLAKGPPRAAFKWVRAIWVYRSAERTIYLHLADDVDPSPLKWSVVWTRDAIVTFRNVQGASIAGLTLAHAHNGVALLDGARGCSVTKCMIGPWDKVGVLLSGGATECIVDGNEITRGSYEDWTPAEPARERYEIWQVHKLAGFYDRVGIDLVRAGENNRIHANHVYETFDGIDIGDSSAESLDKPLPDPNHGKGTEISENVIERTRDSGIELGVGCIDVRVHHNTLRQTHGGLRFKLPRIGPIFIYRNVIEHSAPFNIWYSMDDSPAEGYVYHNTIVGGSVGVQYSSFKKGHQIGAPKWHYLNNLVIADKGFFRDAKGIAPVNFTADYNVVVGGGKPYPNDPAKDQHSRYVTDVKLGADLHPDPASAAIDAGLDLSTYFHGKPLPGCEPGYFKGAAPDAGAFEVK